jgi:hypothetical protein
MASDKMFVIFDDAHHSGTVETQMAFGRTTVAANARHVYWLRGSELVRDDGRGGAFSIGRIAANSTSVWVGEQFGVALVQAGVLNRILTFTERGGFRTMSLPPGLGSVTDAFCVVGGDRAWLILSTQSGGLKLNRCFVIDADAQLWATAVATQGDGTWLGNITPAAHATGRKLLVSVPGSGIARVGIAGRYAKQELVYPDSSRLVQHYGTTSISPIAQTL